LRSAFIFVSERVKVSSTVLIYKMWGILCGNKEEENGRQGIKIQRMQINGC